MRRNKLANFFILGFIVVIALVVVFVLPKLVSAPIGSQPFTQEVINQTLNLEFNFGDEVLEFNDVQINNGETLFDLVYRVTRQNSVEFSYKDFGSDLGIFIESINNSSEQGSKTKWWQYWINGEYASVGISGYQVKAGDDIIFEFTDSKYE